MSAHTLATREDELEQQTRLLRVVLDNADLGIAYFNNELELSLWNDRYFTLHGFPDTMKRAGLPAAEMLAVSARWGMFGPDWTEQDVPKLLEIIRSVDRAEMTIPTREGRTLHSIRMRVQGGSGFIVAVRDLTAERIAMQAKDDFVSTVSHELRTPLTAIRGALALLERALGTERNARVAQMLDIAQKNANRLGILIDDILDLERLTRQHTGYVMVPLAIRDILTDAIHQNEPLASEREVSLTSEAAGPLDARGDPGRLLQVLTNLLANAVRHSPKGGIVEVTGAPRGHSIRVEVKDRGAGVPESFIPSLFTPFAQAPAEARRGNGGTGLGLAISRAIVEQHGGRMGYQPRPGGGSTFWLEIPAA